MQVQFTEADTAKTFKIKKSKSRAVQKRQKNTRPCADMTKIFLYVYSELSECPNCSEFVIKISAINIP